MTRKLFDRDAELALVGAALIDASVLDRTALTPEHFAGPRERRVWQAMLELHAENKPLDEITVPERAQVPPGFLAECAMRTPTADNAEHYASIVREYAVTRAVLVALGELRALHDQGKAHGAELLDAAMKAFTGIELDRPRQALTIGQVLRHRFAELDEMIAARERGEPALTGITTGLEGLDNIIGGLQAGIVTILAARPAMGKSAMALGIADAASAAGHGVHVFSLEDTRSAYADRTLARSARVPVEDVRTARLKRRNMHRVMGSAAELARRQTWLYEDISDISADELVRSVRRERGRNRTELVIVDYLTLLRRPRRYDSIHDAVTQNIEVLARAAKHNATQLSEFLDHFDHLRTLRQRHWHDAFEGSCSS